MPVAANLAVVEAATLCLVNQARGEHGLGALRPNADLQSSAQQHTDDMVNQDYFAHDASSGATPAARMQAAGYVDGRAGDHLGENIASGTLDLATPAATVSAWVASPEHLAIILDRSVSDTGIAIDPAAIPSLAQGLRGATYTEDFG
jgi:uncharacterized protein YkwD